MVKFLLKSYWPQTSELSITIHEDKKKQRAEKHFSSRIHCTTKRIYIVQCIYTQQYTHYKVREEGQTHKCEKQKKKNTKKHLFFFQNISIWSVTCMTWLKEQNYKYVCIFVYLCMYLDVYIYIYISAGSVQDLPCNPNMGDTVIWCKIRRKIYIYFPPWTSLRHTIKE